MHQDLLSNPSHHHHHLAILEGLASRYFYRLLCTWSQLTKPHSPKPGSSPETWRKAFLSVYHRIKKIKNHSFPSLCSLAFSHFCSSLRPRLQIRISGPQVSNLRLSPFHPQQTVAMKTLSNHLMLSMVPLALILASSPVASLKYPDKSKGRRKGVFGTQFKAVHHGRSPGDKSLCWSWSQPASQRAAGECLPVLSALSHFI